MILPTITTGFLSFSKRDQKDFIHEVSDWFKRDNLRFICPVSMDLGGHLLNRFGAPFSKLRVIPNVANHIFRMNSSKRKRGGVVRLVLAASWASVKKGISPTHMPAV